jgi:cobalt/nickel transport system permease protein
MHIEPGVLNATKILAANAVAIATLAPQLRGLIASPAAVVKTLLAAAFFSLFMQVWHMPAGPSEIHFVGASTIYFVFGFRPALFGLALGLLLQGGIFAPQDLVHLGVNALSLMLPLIAVHALSGRRLAASASGNPLGWRRIMAFDAPYYAGVVAMVGFWLALGEAQTPLASWAAFAVAYLPVVALEPAFTLVMLRVLKKMQSFVAVRSFTEIATLNVA